MNEATMSDWPKDDQEFADVIFSIVAYRHAKYEQEYREGKERKRVPVADIKLCPGNFGNYIPEMEEISKIQGIDPPQHWKVKADHMLERFYQKGELKVYSECPILYEFSKEGLLYKDLREQLEEKP